MNLKRNSLGALCSINGVLLRGLFHAHTRACTHPCVHAHGFLKSSFFREISQPAPSQAEETRISSCRPRTNSSAEDGVELAKSGRFLVLPENGTNGSRSPFLPVAWGSQGRETAEGRSRAVAAAREVPRRLSCWPSPPGDRDEQGARGQRDKFGPQMCR